MSSFDGRAKKVFLAALSHPAAERQAFVEAACGDVEELRFEVESLLASHGDNEGADREASLVKPPPDPFAAGEMFAGRYRMIARLGQGGMGDVWSADDLVLGIPVALKLMQSTSAAGRSLLLNEARLARRITHPAVCRVFDVGEERGQVFLSMEFVQGEDLEALIHHVGRLPSEKVAEIGGQLCDALAAAHAQGILHRDLKPANILIDENGAVRITDFGIAIMRDAGGHNTGIGPPGYMAPEQLASGASVSERTDIYALGLVLYELLVGRGTLDRAVSGRQLPRPSTIVPGVDPRLERIVMQALSHDPKDRPSSAAEMGARLAVNAGRGASRYRLWLVAAAVVTAAAMIALLLPFVALSGARRLTEQDTILLADFTNTTGEPVFDGTLKVALAVALEQSPFIKVFSDDRVRDALRLMNHPTDERITRPRGPGDRPA